MPNVLYQPSFIGKEPCEIHDTFFISFVFIGSLNRWKRCDCVSVLAGFMMSWTVFHSLLHERVDTWLVRPANESDCTITDCDFPREACFDLAVFIVPQGLSCELGRNRTHQRNVWGPVMAQSQQVSESVATASAKLRWRGSAHSRATSNTRASMRASPSSPRSTLLRLVRGLPAPKLRREVTESHPCLGHHGAV